MIPIPEIGTQGACLHNWWELDQKESQKKKKITKVILCMSCLNLGEEIIINTKSLDEM